MLCRRSPARSALIVALVLCATASVPAQRLVDKNKGTHFETKKGFMDGNLVGTVYYNFGEIGDWLNEPSRSGVWPKGTNHTYVDGVAVIVQSETQDPQGRIIHPLETNYYEYTRAGFRQQRHVRLVAASELCSTVSVQPRGKQRSQHLAEPLAGPGNRLGWLLERVLREGSAECGSRIVFCV